MCAGHVRRELTWCRRGGALASPGARSHLPWRPIRGNNPFKGWRRPAHLLVVCLSSHLPPVELALHL
eukprot:5915935-Prymnesium_polylepis.1